MGPASEPTACIIGAGPYGLGIAAHFRFAGIDFRIFGSPLRRWLSQMPRSMLLKSEGCASSLPDPAGQYTLAQHCREHGLAYSDYGVPVSREMFAGYGLAFQQKLVPNVEDVVVTALSRPRDRFELQLSSGETVRSANVVMATGLDSMACSPEVVRQLPRGLWSHSADHSDLGKFKDAAVAVIGGGQSALEAAAMLREEGATVSLVARNPTIAWNGAPTMVRRPAHERLLRPRTRLGEGLQFWLYDSAPLLFHFLPRRIRLWRVKNSLGPSGAWWLRDRVVGRFPILLGHEVRSAEARGGRVALRLADQSGQSKEMVVDHVLAATGYEYSIENLAFLDRRLKARIRLEDQMPTLSTHFESSVPGLFFSGVASANAFGPVMRFIAGTGHPARRIATRIARAHAADAAIFAEPPQCLEN